MPRLIPIERFEEVFQSVGQAFEFEDLDLLLHRLYGDQRILDIVSDNEPRYVIARKCLEETERTGACRDFLALMLVSPRASDQLRELITQILPELAGQRPTTKNNVEIVIAQLKQTQGDLEDAPVRKAMAESRAAFGSISADVELLKIYKNLHDFLHQLLVRNFAGLRAAADTMDTDPEQLTKLVEFHDQVRMACVQGRECVERLPTAGFLQANESSWLDKMESAAASLYRAINQSIQGQARVSVNQIWSVVEREPARLNRQIFVLAQQLQLMQLEQSFRQVASLKGEAPEIHRACASLRALMVALLGRVVDHTRWQNIDDGLWILDKVFEFRNDNPANDFVKDWPHTRSLARTLARDEPTSDWSVQIISCIDRVEEELVRCDAQGTQAAAMGVLSSTQMFRLYDAFRRQVRFRFFVVDISLKADCAALVAIGAPLQAILTELDDG